MYYFVQNLTELWTDNNLNAAQLAKNIGIDEGTLSKYINKISLPSINNLVKIANYFNCSIDFLLGLTENEQKFSITQDINKTLFYKRYKDLLKTNHKTHYALTKELRISQSSLSDWNKGSFPRIDTLVSLSKYFNVTVEYLVGRTNIK